MRGLVVAWLVALGDGLDGYDLAAMESAAAAVLSRARSELGVRYAEASGLSE
jgi:hypothetical protein